MQHGSGRTGQSGAVAAEYVAFVVVVAAVVAGLWAAGVPARVGSAAEAATCSLFGQGCGPGLDAPPTGPLDDPLVDLDRTLEALHDDGIDIADWLSQQDTDTRLAVQRRARARAADGNAGLQVRYGANRVLVQAEADRLRGVVERDGADADPREVARAARFAEWAASGRQFLWFDPAGDGRVAEVLGDLSRATNVATLVPGTGSDIDNYGSGVLSDAMAVQASIGLESDLQGHAPAAAVVACLCYDAPDTVPRAASASYAADGAAGLASITSQVHGYSDEASMTVFGHSYGSTAVGHGITGGGLAADEVVALGSPGMGVDGVEDLGDGVGRVWGIRHEKDPIALAGMHGRNVDRDSFGAASFHVGDGDLEREWWKPYEGEFHSVYYQDDVALRNMALVTLGQGEAAVGYEEGQ